MWHRIFGREWHIADMPLGKVHVRVRRISQLGFPKSDVWV